MAKNIYDTARADLAKMQAAHKAKQETAKTELRNVTAEIESLTETLKADASRQDGNAYSSHFIRRSMLNERRNQLERELTNSAELTATEYNDLTKAFRKQYLAEVQSILKELHTAAAAMGAAVDKIKTATESGNDVLSAVNASVGAGYGLLTSERDMVLLAAGYDLLTRDSYTSNIARLFKMFTGNADGNAVDLVTLDMKIVADELAAIA